MFAMQTFLIGPVIYSQFSFYFHAPHDLSHVFREEPKGILQGKYRGGTHNVSSLLVRDNANNSRDC